MSEVLETVAPRDRIAVLSGPNHAEEVARDNGLELPITEAVCSVADGTTTALEALAGLMAREPVEE